MADVFLSYSSRDRAAAQRVQEALSARGIDVFWDQQTPPGQDWDTWIRAKLSNCKVAVVLWSKASVTSDNVRHEALVARKAKKLLPAMIDAIEAEDLPMGLYMVQTTNLTDWRSAESAGLARLVAEVEARVGKRTPGAAPVSTPQPARKINWVGVAIGLVLVAGAVGLTQWMYGPKTTPASPGLTSLPCSNGLPRLNTGECPLVVADAPGAECLDGSTPVDGVCANGNRPIPPAPVLGGGSTAQGLAARLAGLWHWEDQPCALGTEITFASGQLVFHTEGEQPFVHRIDSDTPEAVSTTVVSPASSAGQTYRISRDDVGVGDRGNFNIMVATGSDGHRWFPCPAMNAE